jgi:hypothetical protein
MGFWLEHNLLEKGSKVPMQFLDGSSFPPRNILASKKLEVRKMPENAAESPPSSARFVGRLWCV